MDDSDKWAIPPGQEPLDVGMEEEGEKDSEGVTQIERHIVEMEEKLEVERMKLERKLERRKSLEEAEEQETAKKKKVKNSSEDAVLKNIQDDGNSQGMQQTDKSQSGGYGNGKKKGVEDSGKVTGSGGQQLSAPQNALPQRLPQPVGGNVRTMRIRKATTDKGEVAPKTQKKEGKSMGKQGKKDGGEDGKVTNKKDTGPKKDPLEMALLGELGNSEDEMFEVPESFPSGKEEGRKMAKEKENELNVLQGRLQRMYGMARLGMDVVSEVRDLESQIEEVYLQRLDAVKNTARAEWVDGNEKCSRYFFKKVVEEKKTVEGWKDGQGRWRTKKEEMGELVVEFFEDLYSEKEVNPSESTASLTVLQDTLTLEQKKGLVEDFSVEELDKAMSSFGGGKSPGPDGLPIELYKEFWPALKSSLLEVCRERKIVGGAPKEFCEGVIVLLHKKGDRADLKNWRPITLLNADYKLYMKLLTQRVGALASGLISPDQGERLFIQLPAIQRPVPKAGKPSQHHHRPGGLGFTSRTRKPFTLTGRPSDRRCGFRTLRYSRRGSQEILTRIAIPRGSHPSDALKAFFTAPRVLALTRIAGPRSLLSRVAEPGFAWTRVPGASFPETRTRDLLLTWIAGPRRLLPAWRTRDRR
ncbi:hypothetical protein NDU88_004043 [Pleurodeles waltl]|uniref:Reverse transcriptase domain-containing protein n=1 Tax=Pleurodeles waltl TaxID=8319 RepID=A0AAV7REN9_PLEWA|nr:hypothetical protein NDU88_004043 [Pleurodeles waltl]